MVVEQAPDLAGRQRMPHDKDVFQLRKAGGLGGLNHGVPATAAPLREAGKEEGICGPVGHSVMAWRRVQWGQRMCRVYRVIFGSFRWCGAARGGPVGLGAPELLGELVVGEVDGRVEMERQVAQEVA